MFTTIPSDTFQALAKIDTCDVANAIETFATQLRNEGFTDSSIQCRFPSLPPMLGYAMTLKVRTSSPSAKTGTYVDRSDWWSRLTAMPFPHVLVVQDLDHGQAGAGAFVGEIHAAILKALGCVGIVTNGSLRDLPGMQKLNFHAYSGKLSPSHAYAHIVDIGGEVEIAGLTIRPGDLLHGDQHGILRVPFEVAEGIAPVVEFLQQREMEILDYCRSGQFSVAGLQELLAAQKTRGVGVSGGSHAGAGLAQASMGTKADILQMNPKEPEAGN